MTDKIKDALEKIVELKSDLKNMELVETRLRVSLHEDWSKHTDTKKALCKCTDMANSLHRALGKIVKLEGEWIGESVGVRAQRIAREVLAGLQ